MAYWATIVVVWAACLPPLVVAWRSIANPRRLLVFAAFFVLPFACVLAFAGAFLENYLLLDKHVLAGTVWGIPILILVVEAVSLAVYLALRPHLASPSLGLELRDGRRPGSAAIRAPST